MCHGSNPQIIHVCVSDSAVCVWRGVGLYLADPAQLLTVKHCDLAGLAGRAGTYPSLAENAWFVNDLELAETRWITYTMFLWVCTHEVAHLDARTCVCSREIICKCLDCLLCSWAVHAARENVDACTGASKSSNSYLIYSLFICSLLRNNPMVMHGYENDLTCLCNAALPYRLLPLNVALWNIHRRQSKITFASLMHGRSPLRQNEPNTCNSCIPTQCIWSTMTHQ